MANVDFKDPSGPSSPDLASMIQRYNEANARVNPSEASRSALSKAIGANAVQMGNFNKALDIGSTVVGGLGALGVEMNPYVQAALAARSIINAPEAYQQQKREDFAKYGNNTTGIGTFFRSETAPGVVKYLAKQFSGDTSRPDLDPKFRQYLAGRGIDPNSWEGPPIVGPSPQASVSGPFGLPNSPWVNPNIPNFNPMIDLNAIQQKAVQAEQAAQKQAQNDAYLTQQQNDMIDSGDYNDDDYGAMFDGIDDYSVG